VTVLTSESRLVGSATGQLPRVNLLPPEIAEKATFQKVQIGLGCGLLATVGIVGMLFVSASSSVSSAQTDLDSATQQGTKLQAETATYANVTSVYDAAAAAQSQLVTAMGDEVRYSQLLNDLSLSVPSSVWLKSLNLSQSAAAAPAPGTPTTAATASSTNAVTGIGTLTVAGIGFNHDDLALWLESIAGLKTYSNPYFTNSTEALLGPSKKVVNFSGSAGLTSAALSGRYTKPVGG
jgi:Tfp pilus assembly protein PilN